MCSVPRARGHGSGICATRRTLPIHSHPGGTAMSSVRSLFPALLSPCVALPAGDVAIVATDPWGNTGGGGDPVAFTVSRTGAADAALTVNLGIGGTAVAAT